MSAARLELGYLDWAGIEDAMRARMRELDAARWAMGEILAEVHAVAGSDAAMKRLFADHGASLKALGDAMGLTPAGMRALRLTAETFPARGRVSGVGWEHHHAVAVHLADASASSRKRWLRDAARHGWSPAQLVRRLKARPRPAPRVYE